RSATGESRCDGARLLPWGLRRVRARRSRGDGSRGHRLRHWRGRDGRAPWPFGLWQDDLVACSRRSGRSYLRHRRAGRTRELRPAEREPPASFHSDRERELRRGRGVPAGARGRASRRANRPRAGGGVTLFALRGLARAPGRTAARVLVLAAAVALLAAMLLFVGHSLRTMTGSAVRSVPLDWQGP